jgi:hypothetical protein
MWTLIILGLVFLGWYIMSPQGEAGAAAEAAPEAPSAPPSAGDNAITDGSEFSSAAAAPAAAETPAAAEAPAESAGSSDDDPFKAP